MVDTKSQGDNLNKGKHSKALKAGKVFLVLASLTLLALLWSVTVYYSIIIYSGRFFSLVVFSGRFFWVNMGPLTVKTGMAVFFFCLVGSLLLYRYLPRFWWAVYPASVVVLLILVPCMDLRPREKQVSFQPSFSDTPASTENNSALSTRRIKLVEEVRKGSTIGPNSRINITTDVPSSALLRFSAGVVVSKDQVPYTLQVFVRDKDNTTRVMNKTIATTRTDWHDVKVDLSGHAGESRRISIVASKPSADQAERVYLSIPRVESAKDQQRLSELPNIALIVIDTLRADHMGAYGYEVRETSPFFKKLWQEQGVLFDKAYSTSSWTTPAVASMFTSLYSARHGAYNVPHGILKSSLVSLPEVLDRAGYRTMGFSGNYLVSPSFNFTQGFDSFHDMGNYIAHWNGDQVIADRFRKEFSSKSRKPLFLYFHFVNPHYPYSRQPLFVPESKRVLDSLVVENVLRSNLATWYGKKFFPKLPEQQAELAENDMLSVYDMEIKRSDSALRHIYKTLESRGEADNTLFIVVSDHGEEFNDHGGFLHRTTLYNEQIRVPFLVAGPSLKKAGSRVSCPVSLIDVMPTILAYAGIEGPAGMEGKSLWPLLQGGQCETRVLYSELDQRNQEGYFLEAAIKGGLKLIKRIENNEESFELYDLAADFSEYNNLYSRRTKAVGDLVPYLVQLESVRYDMSRPGEAPVQQRKSRILRAMGYVK